MSSSYSLPKIGEGRIAGFTSLMVGVMSVGAVLCLRFPGWLTTPELRTSYDLELLRLILALAMASAVVMGLITFVLNRRKHLGALGISAIILAMLLGGPYVEIPDFRQSSAYLGLDWLLLDLFF
ncbi:MAG TPA: hypothetical protein VF502_10755, partial [Stellaceae bacterium]